MVFLSDVTKNEPVCANYNGNDWVDTADDA
jgi:hypothetical protein